MLIVRSVGSFTESIYTLHTKKIWKKNFITQMCEYQNFTSLYRYFTHSVIHYFTHLSLLSKLCLHQSTGNGFQWQTIPFLCVPELFQCNSHSNSQLTNSQQLHSHSILDLCMSFQKAASSQTEMTWTAVTINLPNYNLLAYCFSVLHCCVIEAVAA
jgi:hypothetical protein